MRSAAPRPSAFLGAPNAFWLRFCPGTTPFRDEKPLLHLEGEQKSQHSTSETARTSYQSTVPTQPTQVVTKEFGHSWP